MRVLWALPFIEVCLDGCFWEQRNPHWSLKKGSTCGMIEFFKEPNIDWMGKAKYFYALSGILLLAGWTSVFLNHGLRYGIDFKGGTNVDVRFAQTPNIDEIRCSPAPGQSSPCEFRRCLESAQSAHPRWCKGLTAQGLGS